MFSSLHYRVETLAGRMVKAYAWFRVGETNVSAEMIRLGSYFM